jgi:BREX system ATP-binding protein BrxC/D
MTDDRPTIEARGAIEALRAGVPNRAAIRLLGERDGALANSFLDSLGRCAQGLEQGRPSEGTIVWGGFGAGKTHLLGFMRELALQRNFAVSVVPVSKETPLFDPARLFAAAIRTAEVPGANDDVMTVALWRLKSGTEPFDRLESWATEEARAGSLSAAFPALLWLIPHLAPEDHARIARFFGGGKLSATVVKSWLRDNGAAKLFDIKPTREAELTGQRLRFVPRLLFSAGLSGWCVLLDEVELIGRYSPLQRGRSYAELARWLGMDELDALPGIATVAAFTDDFVAAMFDLRRDEELIPGRLEQKGLARQASAARRCMQELRRMRGVRLAAPDEEVLRSAQGRIADLYHEAYLWRPGGLAIGERRAGKTMRQYIKSWITEWDIERLYGERATIEADTIRTEYAESNELEQAPVRSEGEEE